MLTKADLPIINSSNKINITPTTLKNNYSTPKISLEED